MEKKLMEKEWRAHVRGAEEHAEGINAYCREQGLKNPALHYWKKKLGGPAAKFTSVEIVAPKARQARPLPDAAWLADFLRAYERGGA
jgi:hypothetical protein